MSRQDHGFSLRGLAWTITISIASFVAVVILAATSERFGNSSPTSLQADVYSRSAVGHRGLADFLKERGFGVRHRRRPSTISRPGELWMLLEPTPWVSISLGADFDPVQEVLFYHWVESDPILLVPPKWRISAKPGTKREILTAARNDDPTARSSFESLEGLTGTSLSFDNESGDYASTCVSAWGASYRVSIQQPRFLSSAVGAEALLTCDDKVLVGVYPYPEGRNDILVAADPDLFSNHGLGDADHARFVVDLLSRYNVNAVLFDETIHGHLDQDGLMMQLLRFPLNLLVIHGALLAGIAVWSGAFRFGSPRPAPHPLGFGRQVLIGNIAEMIGVVGRTRELWPRYRKQTIRAVARHFGLGDTLDEGTMQRLLEIEKQRGVRFSIREISKSATERSGRSDRTRRLLESAMQMHQWRKEMTHVD